MQKSQNIFSDEQALLLFKEGDEHAFGLIFKKFYSALCFFSTRLTVDKFAAEDIVQEVLYKLWHKHADFASFESIKAFLYISTKNACLNYLDKEQRKIKHHDFLSALPLEVEEPVLTEIIYAEALREIAVELDHLPEQCGKIIKLMYQDGLTPQEIAKEMDIAVSTVYNQKMRGIAILKKRLSGYTLFLAWIILMLEKLQN